jgi:hypothetical protein
MDTYPDQATSSAAVSTANAATVTIEAIMIAEVSEDTRCNQRKKDVDVDQQTICGGPAGF